MNSEKNCKNCLKATPILFNGNIICPLKGVVTADYFCRKHRLSTHGITKPEIAKCASCSNFLIAEEKNDEITGSCKLFTVRKFNGSAKKACSKYSIIL